MAKKRKKKGGLASTPAPTPAAVSEAANASAKETMVEVKTEAKTEGNGTASETKSQTIAKAKVAKAKIDPTVASKFFKEVKAMATVAPKEVGNGVGLWVGKTRVLKWGRNFPQSDLFFPIEKARELVKAEKVQGAMVKNVAQIRISDKNYGLLMGIVKGRISEVKDAQKTKPKTTAKAPEKGKAASPKKRLDAKAIKATEKKEDTTTATAAA